MNYRENIGKLLYIDNKYRPNVIVPGIYLVVDFLEPVQGRWGSRYLLDRNCCKNEKRISLTIGIMSLEDNEGNWRFVE